MVRAISREPESLEAFITELTPARGRDQTFDRIISHLQSEVDNRNDVECRARRLVEEMALALQGALILQHAEEEIADAFLASRLNGEHGHVFGTLPAATPFKLIIERARPKIE